MNARRVLTFISWTAAATCLAIGAGSAWRWAALGLCGIVTIFWMIKPFRVVDWLPSTFLAGYILAAVSALLAGGNPYWLAPGTCAALISWDLLLFYRSLEETPETKQERANAREHFKALGIVVLASLGVIAIGLSLQIRAPFIVLLAALVGGLSGLLLAWRLLQKKNTP